MFQDGSSKFSDGAINEQTRIDLKFRQSLSLTQLILLAELLRLLRMHYEDTVMPHTAAANLLVASICASIKVFATNNLNRYNINLDS